MATYSELFDYYGTTDYDTLVGKIKVALAIKAYNITEEATPTTEELAWAERALENPNSEAAIIVNYVLAANNGSSIATINAASDVTIQNNVNDAVDNLFGK